MEFLDLPGTTTIGESVRSRVAADVSGDGSVIVGTLRSLQGGDQAFVWSETAGATRLEYLPDTNDNGATGVSDDGRVVIGTSNYLKRGSPVENQIPDEATRSFRWTADGGMEDLGFVAETDSIKANALSGDGSVIVGDIYRRGPSDNDPNLLTVVERDGFIWDEVRGIRDLQEVLVKDFGLGSNLAGWDILRVTDIADDGRTIVGWGTNPSGIHEDWVARLDPPLLAGDANFDGVVDLEDYAVLSKGFQKGRFRSEGDLNADGQVTLADFAVLKAALGSSVAAPEPSAEILAVALS